MNSTIPSKHPKALSGKEICSIIKECKKNGVTRLSYGELSISFTDKIEDAAQELANTSENEVVPRGTVEKSERDKFEEELNELMIADPVAYEERLAMYEERIEQGAL